MMRSARLFLSIVAAVVPIGCCPSQSGPTGAPVVFTATLAPGASAVHDFIPPPRTTQSNLLLTWSSGNLRISELVPTCPAGQEDQCTRLTDPIGAPAATPRTIRNIVTNQRPENRDRMKFLVENTSDEPASYTLTLEPGSAGCT
jgi:hypothetical protein